MAVLPEAEEFDVEISMNDIRKDIFCASGPGGQSVNTTYSAIRLTHIPTGIVVQCQDQKSQLKNFDKAFEELRTRVFNLEYSKYLDEIASKRKTMVSTGDRSAKIRTYNYPQGRITDHRINYTIYNLAAFMDGDIQDVHRPPDRGRERRAPEGERVVRTAPMGAPIPACVLPPGRQHRGNPGLPWPTGLGRGTCRKPLSTENHCKPTN